MKKLFAIALSLLIISSVFVFSFTSFASQDDRPQVIDYTGRLTEAELEEYNSRLRELKDEYSYDAVVVLIDQSTVEEYGITNLEVFADDTYDNGGYGVGEYNDGILVLLRLGEPYSNHFNLCTTGSLEAACYEEDIDDMYYKVRPYLVSDDASGAVDGAISAEEDFFITVNDRANEKGFHPVKKALISLAVGFVVALVVVLVMKGKLKSVAQKNNAADYVVRGSFDLRESRDLFLYANVSKTPRAQDNSSRGGGGAGAHFSSSGVSHGGGTR